MCMYVIETSSVHVHMSYLKETIIINYLRFQDNAQFKCIDLHMKTVQGRQQCAFIAQLYGYKILFF